jgi:hypothetical protein
MDYWVPVAYCYRSTAELVALQLVLSLSTLWTLVAGLAMVRSRLYLLALLLWGYKEELLLYFVLSRQFPDSRPACTLLPPSAAALASARAYALPTPEIQLGASLSVFLLVHMIVHRVLLPLRLLLGILLLPLLSAAILYATANATAFQLAAALLLGSANGLRRSLLYEGFLRPHFTRWLSYRPFCWFFSFSDSSSRAVAAA